MKPTKLDFPLLLPMHHITGYDAFFVLIGVTGADVGIPKGCQADAQVFGGENIVYGSQRTEIEIGVFAEADMDDGFFLCLHMGLCRNGGMNV